jgi:hypothetical protein
MMSIFVILVCDFLGAFAKLRKATISFVKPACLSVTPFAWNDPATTGRIYDSISLNFS